MALLLDSGDIFDGLSTTSRFTKRNLDFRNGPGLDISSKSSVPSLTKPDV